MKYLCIGYFSPSLSASHPDVEIHKAVSECEPHLKNLHASGKLIVDLGVEKDTYRIFRENGEQKNQEVLLCADKMIGSVTVLDAETIQEALELAKLHPAVQVATGEYLGWELEVRPIHRFELKLLDN